jgi:hypothetical protein
MMGSSCILGVCILFMLLAGCGIPNIDVAELNKTIAGLKNQIQELKLENDDLKRTVQKMQDSQKALSDTVSQLASRPAQTIERAGAYKADKSRSEQPESSSASRMRPPPERIGSGKPEEVDIQKATAQDTASERLVRAELCSAIEKYISDVESAMRLDVVSRDFALQRSFSRFEAVLNKHKNHESIKSVFDKALRDPALNLRLDAAAVPKAPESQFGDSKWVDALSRHQLMLRSFCRR